MYIFTVEPVMQLFFSGLTHRDNLSGEIECLPGHRGVEVHFHVLFLDFEHLAWNDTAFAVQKRDSGSRNQEAFLYDPVDFKSLFREIDYPVRVHFSVSFLRGECESEFPARFKTFYPGLEFRKERACPVYIVKGLFSGRPVDDLPVHFKFIAEFHYFVLSDFHNPMYVYVNITFSHAG